MTRNNQITVTVSGFINKADAMEWIRQYESGLEQQMFNCTCYVDMYRYITETRWFEIDDNKYNFNLRLEPHKEIEVIDETK